MKYNINYSNIIGGNNRWKKTLYWKQAINDKGIEFWSGNENEYDNMFNIHGTINLLNYGHNGIEANTMISLYAAYKILTTEELENNINSEFIDDCINTGIDLYQAFLNTESGKRINSKNKTLYVDFEKIIYFFNKLYKNINYYDASLVEFAGKYTSDIYNYNNWLFDNIEFYTDKNINDISNYACIILTNSESYCLVFINDNIYLFDPIGRGHHFFNIPKNENQHSFINNSKHNLFYSNDKSYIVKVNNYEIMKKFIKKTLFHNLKGPYMENTKSMYISLK
jgi:hypothetical protein